MSEPVVHFLDPLLHLACGADGQAPEVHWTMKPAEVTCAACRKPASDPRPEGQHCRDCAHFDVPAGQRLLASDRARHPKRYKRMLRLLKDAGVSAPVQTIGLCHAGRPGTIAPPKSWCDKWTKKQETQGEPPC